MSVASGLVLVDQSYELLALDVDTGDELWKTRAGHGLGVPPVVTADTVYLGAWSGGGVWDHGLVALDPADGSERWRAISNTHVESPPTLARDTVYVCGNEGYEDDTDDVIALDATDGEEQWRFSAGSEIPAPAVVDGIVYVGSETEGGLYALDADTGDELWNVPVPGTISASPTVVGDTVYVPTDRGAVHALDAADGSERWAFEELESGSSVAATDESVYAHSYDELTALDADGTERWSVDTATTALPPTVAGASILVADRKRAYCFDAEEGTELWRLEPEDRSISDVTHGGILSPPVVAGDVAFVGSAGGDVHAIQ